MPTNTRESGLEALIVNWLVERNGYELGKSSEYNREYAFCRGVDFAQSFV